MIIVNKKSPLKGTIQQQLPNQPEGVFFLILIHEPEPCGDKNSNDAQKILQKHDRHKHNTSDNYSEYKECHCFYDRNTYTCVHTSTTTLLPCLKSKIITIHYLRATRKTSSIVLTNTNFRSFLTSLGISSKSFLLSIGNITVFSPAL